MEDQTPNDLSPDELIQFQPFPRETLRAYVEIFDTTNPQDILYCHLRDARATVEAILKDRAYKWPLTVKVGSELWHDIRHIHLLANKHLLQVTKRIGSNLADNIGYYMVKLLDFYDSGIEVSYKGVLISDEAVVLRQPTRWGKISHYGPQTRMAKKMSRKHGIVYSDDALGSQDCLDNFNGITTAAQIKSRLYPPLDDRTEEWQEVTERFFADGVPAELRNFMTIAHQVREQKSKQDVEQDTNVDQEMVPGTSGLSIADGETATPPPSADTRAMSPIPTKHPDFDVEDHKNNFGGSLKLTYLAILETPTEKVTINIDPAHVDSPESMVLAIAKKLWNWLCEQDMKHNAKLEDVVALARKIVVKVGGMGNMDSKVLYVVQDVWAWTSESDMGHEVKLDDVIKLARTMVAEKKEDGTLDG